MLKRIKILGVLSSLTLSSSVVAIAPQNAYAQNVEQLVSQGLTARDAQKYSEATSLLRQAVQQDPKNVGALVSFGVVLQDQGKLDAAIGVYRQAAQVSPNNAQVRSALTVALDQKSDIQRFRAQKLNTLKTQITAFETTLRAQDSAIAKMTRIIQRVPNKPSSYENYVELGNALMQRNRTGKEHFAGLREVHRLEPSFPLANRVQEDWNNEEKRLNQAIAAYQKALQLNPNLPDAYYGLGNAMYEQNQFGRAIEAYQKALQLNPNDVFTQHQLQKAQQRLKQQRIS